MKRLLLIGALLASACGGNSTAPSAPTVSFTGVYSGTYRIAACSDGSIIGFCASAGFVPGTVLPISFSAGQNANSVSGNIMLGSISGNFQGTANGSGLTGTAAMNSLTVSGITVLTNITSWSSTLNGNSQTGNFTVTFAVAGVVTPGTLTANLVTLSR